MFNNHCRKQVEPEIGEIPIAWLRRLKGVRSAKMT
jgi:hypothetical protein